MTDRERLVQWMRENGFDTRSLAAATGDTYSNVHWMTKDTDKARAINEAFMWRFGKAFGFDEAARVFLDAAAQPEPA